MLDFNDNPRPDETGGGDRETIRAALLARLESVLKTLFPAGRVRGPVFVVGNIGGDAGDSLEVVLNGDKAGLWTDRAEGTGGDVFALIASRFGLDARVQFRDVLQRCEDLLGTPAPTPSRCSRKPQPVDDLGPPTAKWQYRSPDGQLLAVVSRYDLADGSKTFRPWDVQRRKEGAPDPRPLYNLPGIAAASLVILVEGEKCAQALIDAGLVATTAMHGANAPVDKTDWSPLQGKTVLIWPDKDNPGWAYAEKAAQATLQAGAASCTILYPPTDAPEGWDAADALNGNPEQPFDVAGFLSSANRMPVACSVEDHPPPDLLTDLDWTTEDGLATAFTRHYSHDWKYCALWGRWLVWTGSRWSPDQVLYVSHLVRGVCRVASRLAGSKRLRGKLASRATFAAVEAVARSDPRHATTADEWDADPWRLNTPGGVVDLQCGALQEHRREDRMTKLATATPRGECPTWITFLTEVTGGDAELMAYLQRMAGYCLTGATQEHALFFLYGTGANGKSVFVNTLASILGDYAANAPMDTFMESRTDRHPTDLAGLRGARFVASIETEDGGRWAEAKIKSLTGGDRISARFMRQDFFEFTPQFKLVIAGNHKPAIRNVDEAMRRRLHLIPFTVTIPGPRRDKQLPQKLLNERDGILHWALRGCLSWQQEGGLKPPRQVVEATDEYFEAEDAIGRWLDERCVRQPNAKSLTAELFSDWKQWAEAGGEFIGTQRRLSDQLLTRGIEKWRNPSGIRGFQGIGLKEKPREHFIPYADL